MKQHHQIYLVNIKPVYWQYNIAYISVLLYSGVYNNQLHTPSALLYHLFILDTSV